MLIVLFENIFNFGFVGAADFNLYEYCPTFTLLLPHYLDIFNVWKIYIMIEKFNTPSLSNRRYIHFRRLRFWNAKSM